MNNIQDPSNKTKEIISWLAVLLVTVLAFFANYYYQFSGPIKALIWIGWFILTLAFSFYTREGRKAYDFGKEAKLELQKVVWPNRQETIQTTTIVMVMVGITGFVLWGIDSGMMWAIGKITHLG